MSERVSTIPNLGPAMEQAFEAAGITSAEMLRDLGADTAYQRLLEDGARPHFIAYYALVMGLQGRPWNDCKGAEKEKLRARFDTLVQTADRHPSEFARALDEIGVRLTATAEAEVTKER